MRSKGVSKGAIRELRLVINGVVGREVDCVPERPPHTYTYTSCPATKSHCPA